MRYYKPGSCAGALAALAEQDGRGRVLVGGTDLLVGLRHRTVEPTLLVDIKGVADLPAPLTVDDDGVTAGPLLSMAALAGHPQVRRWYPGLADAALTVGSVAIRNRASLIGNVCNGSPAADTAPALLVLGAIVTIASPRGERAVPLAEFFLAPRRTRCAADEIVTALRLPRPAGGSGTAIRRLTRRRGVDLATVSVAAAVDGEHRVTLGLGAVGPTPLLSRRSEPVDLDAPSGLTAAVEDLLEGSNPITDVRASREYRMAMIRVLARRAILAAAGRRTSQAVAP